MTSQNRIDPPAVVARIERSMVHQPLTTEQRALVQATRDALNRKPLEDALALALQNVTGAI